MTDLNGIETIDRDDPRFTAIADATTFSGFTALAEADPERPSNRRIAAMALIALFLAAVLAQITFLVSTQLTDEYRARAEVQYRGSAWTETQDVAVQSRSLTAPVAAEFNIPIKDFEENLDAGLVPGTQILRIDYIDADQELARSIVDRLSTDYISEISELPSSDATAILERELAEVETEIELRQQELRDIAAKIDGKRNDESNVARDENGEVEIGLDGQPIVITDDAQDRADQQAAQQLLSSLRVRKNDLEFRLLDTELRKLDKLENGSPEVITAPFVFEDPVFPRPRLFAAIAFVVGLAIGGVIMMLNWNRTAWASIDRLTNRLPGGNTIEL